MNKQNVLSILIWLRRMDQASLSHREITLGRLFKEAYICHYGKVDLDASIRIDFDIKDFHKYGRIPVYVAHLVTRVIYPNFDAARMQKK